MAEVKEYVFTYYGWIPGYNDFDQNWVPVKATNLEEAKEKLSEMNIFPKYDPVLDSINGVPVRNEKAD